MLSCVIPENYKKFKAKEDESLYIHTENLLKEAKTLSKMAGKRTEKLLRLACIYHDIGKVSGLFQERIKNKNKFNSDKEIGHNIISAIIARNILISAEPNLTKDDIRLVVLAVLNHHYYTDNLQCLHNEKNLIKNNLEALPKEYLEQSKLIPSIELRKLESLKNKPSGDFILLKGFLHKCDYAASAHRAVENLEIDLKERLEKLNYRWNSMQEFAHKHSEENIILEGSTGMGKTEAALLWLNNSKGFYVLPIKTAIDAMYERLKKDLYNNEEYIDSIGLLHGDTQNYYLTQTYDGGFSLEDGNDEINKFWHYYEMTKNMALPLTISTLDQIFRFVFKHSTYEVSLATYSYSKIIIDEIQAYEPRLLAYLIYGLQMIHEIGGRFAIITATLPPFVLELLEEKYVEGNKICQKIPYKKEKFYKRGNRHNIALYDEMIEADDIIDFVYKNESIESMKILIVLNTVKKAQTFYREMSYLKEDGYIEVHLIHAKFIKSDRRKKEKHILRDGSTECKKRVIWIATQVVEASLDIDFDYLFTELSDLNGLFQRMGRCNRRGTKEIYNPNVFVYLQTENIKKKSNSKGFIDYGLYKLAQEALLKWYGGSTSGIISEEEKAYMLNEHYTIEKLKGIDESVYLDSYKKAFTSISSLAVYSLKLKDVIHEFRNIISVSIIPGDVYNNNNLEEKIKKLQEYQREYGKDRTNSTLLKYMTLKKEIMDHTVQVGITNNINNNTSEVKIGGTKVFVRNMRYSFEIGVYEYEETEGSIFL